MVYQESVIQDECSLQWKGYSTKCPHQKLERSHSNSLLLHVISLENKMKQKLLKSTIWEEIIKIGSISRAKNFQTISRIMK